MHLIRNMPNFKLPKSYWTYLYMTIKIEGLCGNLLDTSRREFAVNATSGSPTASSIQIGPSGWIAATSALSEYIQVTRAPSTPSDIASPSSYYCNYSLIQILEMHVFQFSVHSSRSTRQRRFTWSLSHLLLGTRSRSS